LININTSLRCMWDKLYQPEEKHNMKDSFSKKV